MKTQTAKTHWKIADLPWDQCNPALVTPDMLALIKAAALVEYNAHSYADYLCSVFPDDPVLQNAARAWAPEEVQHGEALGQWAERIDPAFDFKTAMARFREGYKIDTMAAESVRGSHAGELIARCIVETGTSSYYMALADATEEPVLKAICRNIATDEIHHYKMFYTHLMRYLEKEKLSRLDRLRIGLGRIRESEDDELAYAFYAANTPADQPYDRKTYSNNYARLVYRLYKPRHVERVVTLVLKACGVQLHAVLHHGLNRLAWWAMRMRQAYASLHAAA